MVYPLCSRIYSSAILLTEMSLISWQPSFVPAGENVFSGLFPSLEMARDRTLATKQTYMDNIQQVIQPGSH
jgi:hypothetical protein